MKCKIDLEGLVSQPFFTVVSLGTLIGMLAGVRLLWWKLRLGEQVDEADSSAPRAVDADATSTADDNCDTTETGFICSPEDGDDCALLIEDSVLTSRSVMASAGPPPPPPPPSSFGSLRLPPSTPSPSRTPPPVSTSPPPLLETADKAVQSTGSPQNTGSPLRRTEFARTVHTFFKEPLNSRSNVNENTADGAVQTSALVHAENPEVMVRSLVVPLALAAPCRSKPPRCPPSSSYERRGNSQLNGQISPDANNCAAGGDGDAVSVAISSTGSSSPRYGFEDYHERARRRNSHGDDRSHKESCMESCVYYSVKCCECIVL